MSVKKSLSYTRIHHIWRMMRHRCNCTSYDSYKHYGGRGIKVCEEWENSFQRFYEWATVNGYTDELTIDRIDVNGNYEPSNCRWVTRKVQCNNRRDNHFVTLNGCTKSLAEWADTYGIKRDTISHRIIRGWDIERAVTTPVKRGAI